MKFCDPLYVSLSYINIGLVIMVSYVFISEDICFDIDDKNGLFMLQNTKAKKYTLSIKKYAIRKLIQNMQ